MEILTNERLCILAQSGDEWAVSRLIEVNRSFIQKIANQFSEDAMRREHLSACGIDVDDLVQAGSIGLWRAIDGYRLSEETKFLTYAAPAVRRAMSDMIRQHSRDTVWQLRHSKHNTWKIIYLDECLNDSKEDSIECLIASPCAKLPEQILIEKETIEELNEAINALPDRENVYIQYRFGFADGKAHPLTDTARYFHLTESRSKSVERSALKLLRHELFVKIPERACTIAEDRLTKMLVSEGELHAVELRLKSQQKRGRKTTAAVYEYLADCDGTWGELQYNFKDDTVEVLVLADWDTMISRRFAMRAVEHLRQHRTENPPEKLILTFISPEQIECFGKQMLGGIRYDNQAGTST